MLETLAALLESKGLINSLWYPEAQENGKLVKLYRDYFDGYHRIQLTAEMKKMLNITDERLQRYNTNYCELIISSMADRLTIDKMEYNAPKLDPAAAAASDNNASEMAQAWIDETLACNRFDALQIAVREAVLRDGETFVMSEWDEDEAAIKLCHEPAYDGTVGTLVIFERGSKTEIAAAVKIWFDVPPTQEQVQNGEDDENRYMRANIYYPDAIEKYFSDDGVDVSPLIDPETGTNVYPTTRILTGAVPGVPIVRFSNKGGVSELVNIIPLQDSLNSFLVDLVMNAQLTAFSIFFAVGVEVPQGITPGMVIRKNVVDANGNMLMPESVEEADMHAKILAATKLERIQGGDLSQIISAMDMVINQIAVISATPIPTQMGSSQQSGEALKQRDVRLLGKLNRAQVQLGNSWEDVVLLANWQYVLFSGKASPAIEMVNTRWKSAEMRNNADILAAAVQLQTWGFEREALRLLGQSSLVSYTEADIDRMMTEKAADVASKMETAMGGVNGFGSVNVPTLGASPLNFNPTSSN